MASYFTTTLGPKRGFHPTFRTVISLPNGPWKGRQLHSNELLDGDTPRHSTEETTRCTLHVAHALPSTLFADPYELELRRDQFTFLLLGEHNLEFPVHAMTGTGQRLVLNVSLSSDTREIVVEFPLHLRYAEPGHGGHRPVAVPSPAPFWACPSLGPANQDNFSTAQPLLPAEIAAIFGSTVTLQNIQPATVPAWQANEMVDIPMGNIAHLALVDVGTSVAILVCFAYVTMISWRAMWCLEARQQKVKAE